MKKCYIAVLFISTLALALTDFTSVLAAEKLAKKQVLTIAFDAGDSKSLDPHRAATTVDSAMSTENRIQQRATIVGYLVGVIQPHGLAIVNPLERHSGNVGPEDLLRYVVCKSCEHGQLRSLCPHYYNF